VPSAITWASDITGHLSLAMRILKKENVGHLNKWILKYKETMYGARYATKRCMHYQNI